jgi:enolase
MPRITAITARQILDSRGIPTVEATVTLDSGHSETSSSPSGASGNKQEAVELRDHVSTEYFGQGVSKAVTNVNTLIAEKLKGMDPLYQTQIDQALVDLDGTTNKSRLGANAILAVSQAVLKVAAASLNLPVFMYVKEKYQLMDAYRVPTPIFNLINGGRHGSGALDFQEFQLVPASHLPYGQALRVGVEVFLALDKILEQKGAIRTVGLEGGYAPNLATNTDALEIFTEAMKITSYALAQDAFLGLDVTPKWFYKNGKYSIKDRPQPMSGQQLVKFYQDLHHQYRVFSFEDPLLEDAWNDWKYMTAEMGESAMIVADNLVATNKTLLIKAIQEKACNALVIKPNRAGTVTETIEVISLAKKAGWHTIMSHRSGETTDDVLADIAVGVGTDYVKFGAPSRGERVVKYNRLLRIEETLLRSSQNAKQAPGVTAMEPTNQPTMPAEPMISQPPATPAPVVPSPNPEPIAPMPAEVPPAPAEPVAPVAPALPLTPPPAAAPTPFASIFSSASPAMPAAPAVSPFMAPVGTPPSVLPNPAPEVSVPAAPAPEVTPAAPALEATPVPEAVWPTPAAATPAAPAPVNEVELQGSINELVKMVPEAPASAPAAPLETTPSAPALETPAVSAPATPAAPAAFPTGLTPPTPPQY